MKKRTNLIFLSLIFSLVSFQAVAETARWVIKPVYQSVTKLSDNLYKVKQKNGVTSVVDGDGRTVVMAADSVTPFVGEQALVLVRNKNGLRLDRILKLDKSTVTLNDEMYVDRFLFFSEGLMPVTNKSGKAGYIDTNGNLIIPFKYSNPRPFSNGMAAVSKGKNMIFKMMSAVGMSDLIGKDKVYYINTLGGELKLPKDIGDIYFGSTFKNGEALVINKDRQFCFINPQGQLLRIEPSVALYFDDMMALSDGDEPAESVVTQRPSGPDVFAEGQMLGYRLGSKIILTPQFSSAEPFYGNHAVATRLGATGVLELIKGDIAVTVKDGTIPASSADMVSKELIVEMPKEYKGVPVEVEVADEKGVLLSNITDADNGTGKHTISLMLPKKDYQIRIIADNLEVWTANSKALNQRSQEASEGDVKFIFSTTKVKANAKDAGAVAITIVNDSDKPFTGTVKMSGASPSVKKVTVPAGGRKQVSAYFSKITKKETRVVTISVGGHSASRRISLEPFFNL